MIAVQALTGRGGWPMSVWLAPDRKPFYGGTYFPARGGDRGAAIGLRTILEKRNENYHAKDGRVENERQPISDAIRKTMTTISGDRLPDKPALKICQLTQVILNIEIQVAPE